ncbi:hypothetical protein AAG906_040820 [Vitis piasezkii]
MANLLLLTVLTFFFISTASAIDETSLPPPPSPFPRDKDHPFSPTSLFSPILINLGFHDLAMAIHSVTDSTFTAWSGPTTIFAPTDASIRSCMSCSVPRLLKEHIVAGAFSFHYLRTLAFGTKMETMVPGRCVTVTSAGNNSRIFIGGVEITHPDLFNNGLIVVHGLDGFVTHLSPYSCNIERMTSLLLPPQPSERPQSISSFSITRLMLRDAMLRLRISGYGILSLALGVKYAELVALQNMTVFALDDASIFSGGHEYIHNVRFHIVPNRMLMAADLAKLPVATVLPTLSQGQKLMVTTAGGGPTPMMINYVRIKATDVIDNPRVAIHALYSPFPHLQREVTAGENIGRSGFVASGSQAMRNEPCTKMDGNDCAAAPAPAAVIRPPFEMEDKDGL